MSTPRGNGAPPAAVESSGPSADQAGSPPATPADSTAEVRFPVSVGEFSGTLDQLVVRAQRGEIDLARISVAEITAAFRDQLASDAPPDPSTVAEFLNLASRLLALKAGRLLPEGSLQAVAEEAADDEGAVDDPGARLAEYRLFRAAADALLAGAAEQGMRSFLGLVSAEVMPSERLSIPPERLAAALRRVLERIAEAEPLPLELVTFSVPEKVAALRELISVRRSLSFDEIFDNVTSRLEAVAVFLALLELVKSGAVRVDQESSFGEIMVTAQEGP
jgi:segregation and condensation protein A